MARTYNEMTMDARRRLRETGMEEYSLEARRLVAYAAECSEAELLARANLYSGEKTEERLEDALSRRIAGEPLAYICSEWEFYGRRMTVTPDVLIPRIDTEVLVSTALEFLRTMEDPRILDLCCGSGCIGCVLGAELPSARLVLADVSPGALSVARQNVNRHDLGARIVCLEADALLPPAVRMHDFDMIVSNPPYIAEAELAALDPSVRDWEPHIALDGGEDGLKFYRSIIRDWKSVLRDNGVLILEVGEGEASPVQALLQEAGFSGIGSVQDTVGTERVVFGLKNPETTIEA